MRRFAIAALLVAPSLAAAQQVPLVVTTEWLADHLRDANVVIIQAGGRQPDATAERIPGTRYVPYAGFAITVNGIANELPTPDSLRSLFASVGVSDDSHVILTGQQLSVTRAFYSLDYLGHPRISVLDGGLTKWKREGRAVESSPSPITPGRLTPRPPRADAVVSTDWVLEHINKPGIAFFDTRTVNEYTGAEGANGHIAGARFVDYREFFVNGPDLELTDRATLERLFSERAAQGDTIVAYCAVGFRASGTYFIGRLLGRPVRLYDGSDDAWSKRRLPTFTAAVPLRNGQGMARSGGELPVVSPTGKDIAYVALRDGRQTDTYVIGADGKGERRITTTPEFDDRPSWIGGSVFASVRAGDSVQTMLVDPKKSRSEPTIKLAGREVTPSPDGGRLLSSSGDPFPLLLRSRARDGSDERVLHDGKTPPATNAAWSPDGKRIAYYAFDMSVGGAQVFVMNADGTDQKRLTQLTNADGRVGHPAWSPDGKRLAIQVVRDNVNPKLRFGHIYVIEVATNALTKLAPHEPGYSDEAPSWFPDGQHIAFQSDRTGAKEIWVMKADGTDARQLTKLPER